MKNKKGWYSILLIGLVVLLASSMVACGEEVPLSSPNIGFSPSSLSFSAEEGGANPASKTLSISNSGGGTLDWTVSADANWVSLSPTSGASTGESDSVTVSVDIMEWMAGGDYAAIITIAALGASNSPQKVAVDLDIVLDEGVPPTELKTYSKYGFSFEYPADMLITEYGLVGTCFPVGDPDEKGGGVIGASEGEIVSIIWMTSPHGAPLSELDIRELAFKGPCDLAGLANTEEVVIMSRKEIVEIIKNSYQVLCQEFTAEVSGAKMHGAFGAWYSEGTTRFYQVLVLCSEENALARFNQYLESFVCH